ncbi:MAG: hypothetical protein GY930_05865 [bacterium]|nr:hypothetical protein [bacterium]
MCATIGVLIYSLYVVSVGGDFMVLSRFFVPILPLAIHLAFESLQTQRRLTLALATVLALGMQWNQVPGTDSFAPRKEARSIRRLMQEGFKHRWARLGARFKGTVPAGSSVAISPIGAFGWTSELPLVDILGLTNDSVLDTEPDLDFVAVKGHHRSNYDWILDKNPEYVILGNGVRDQFGFFTICPWEKSFYHSLREGTRFAQGYRRAQMQISDGMPLDLFIRRDVPLPAETSWWQP